MNKSEYKNMIINKLLISNEAIKCKYNNLYFLEIDNQKNSIHYLRTLKSLKTGLFAEEKFYQVNKNFILNNIDIVCSIISSNKYDGLCEADLLFKSGEKANAVRTLINTKNIVEDDENYYVDIYNEKIKASLDLFINGKYSVFYLSLLQEKIDSELDVEVKEELIKYKYNYLFLDVNLSKDLIENNFEIPKIDELEGLYVFNDDKSVTNFSSVIYSLLLELDNFTDGNLCDILDKKIFDLLLVNMKLILMFINNGNTVLKLKENYFDLINQFDSVIREEVFNIFDDLIYDKKRYLK